MGNDDLIGLGAIILLAGGAYFLLSSGALSGSGNMDASGFVTGTDNDPGTVTGSNGGATGLTSTAAAKTCSQLCQLGWCTSHSLKNCSGCSKCPNKTPAGTNCKALCTASNCAEYRTKCNGACSNCQVGGKCPPCAKGYVLAGPGCTCKLKSGATGGSGIDCSNFGCSTGTVPVTYGDGTCGCKAARARAFTGRVTYSQQPWHRSITRS